MGLRLVPRLHQGCETVNLPDVTLTVVQQESLGAAVVRMAAVDAPLPESIYQDTAGTLHLLWHQLGARIEVTLARTGRIDSAVTLSNVPGRNLASLLAFSIQLQEFFAI